MTGIDAALTRINQIQQRMAASRPPAGGEFEAILNERLDIASARDDATAGAASGLLTNRSYGAGVTVGTFLNPVTPPPALSSYWAGGVASVAELNAYVASNAIEARNGRLDAHEMVPVPGGWDGRTVQLLPPAAEAWNAMRTKAAAEGINLQAVDSYRDWATQDRAHREYLAGNKPANVLPAGHSQHGNGLAVDVTNGSIIGRDDPEWHWLQANARRFGWYPISNETWHWEFRGLGA